MGANCTLSKKREEARLGESQPCPWRQQKIARGREDEDQDRDGRKPLRTRTTGTDSNAEEGQQEVSPGGRAAGILEGLSTDGGGFLHSKMWCIDKRPEHKPGKYKTGCGDIRKDRQVPSHTASQRSSTGPDLWPQVGYTRAGGMQKAPFFFFLLFWKKDNRGVELLADKCIIEDMRDTATTTSTGDETMTIEQLATKISYQQCLVSPENCSAGRWMAMIAQAVRFLDNH